jgi:hypothetical protein
MFVGSVYWFLSMATDLSGCRVTIYDFQSENVVWDSEKCDGYDIAVEVDDAGYGDYEIESYDLWVDTYGKAHLEINISIEEDE